MILALLIARAIQLAERESPTMAMLMCSAVERYNDEMARINGR